MITAHTQVDLNNPLAVKYSEASLKSFEIVSDIFQIEVVQCVTPETNTLNLQDKGRSPQEKASIASHYRYMKRIADGERMFVMEHDAYLLPERVDIFRMIMSKYKQLLVCNIGIAMEFYTCHPDIAKRFCEIVENDDQHNYRGPMTFFHVAADEHHNKHKGQGHSVYWPKNGKTNETGLSHNASTAFRTPKIVLPAPVTQLIDESVGNTVTDRSGVFPYNRKSHPNFHFMTLAK